MTKETYENIGNGIFIFNEIEFFINCIITHQINPTDKEFFMDTVLNTSVINYGTKIKLIINLKIFEKKDIDLLRKLASYRNVFAHSNRSNFISLSDIKENVIKISVEDVIYLTNSEGKITKKKYNDFIIEFNQIKIDAIQLIHNYIEKNNVKTFNKFSTNLLRFIQ